MQQITMKVRLLMSYLTSKFNVTEEEMLQKLMYARTEFKDAENALELQLNNPQPGEYGSTTEHGTLQKFYAYANAKQEYDETLETLTSSFEYL